MTVDAQDWEFQRTVYDVYWQIEACNKQVSILVESDDASEARLRAWLWALENGQLPEKMEHMRTNQRLMLVC